MPKLIDRQNAGIVQAQNQLKPHHVYNNTRLAMILGIQQPPVMYTQNYMDNDIEVSVLC